MRTPAKREAERRWDARNSTRRAEAARRRRREFPEKQRDVQRRYDLKRFYGIGSEEYNAALHKQDFKCAVCGSAGSGHSNKTNMAVDHDHTTGHVRGLLCHQCNTGLGLFRDNPDILMKAADYLLKDNLKNH